MKIKIFILRDRLDILLEMRLSGVAEQIKVEILDNTPWVVQKRFCTMEKDVPVKTAEDILIPDKSPVVILVAKRDR